MPPPLTSALPQPPNPTTNTSPSNEATCYRHSDRNTGRNCTRCGISACGDCLVSANIGSHCLSCAKESRPDTATRARFWSARQPALITTVVMITNAVVFLGLGFVYNLSGMLSGQVTEAHIRFGLSENLIPSDNNPTNIGGYEGDQWYRLITSGFLHYGVLHLAMNMYFLWLLGNQMEGTIGRGRFLLIYLAGLLGGSAGALTLGGGGVTAGASGAVFGLMGAYAISTWRHGINVFQTSIGTLLVINLFLTFAIRNISIGGHLGGLVAGSLCGFVMLAPGWRGLPRWATWVTPIAVSLIAVGVSVAVVP